MDVDVQATESQRGQAVHGSPGIPEHATTTVVSRCTTGCTVQHWWTSAGVQPGTSHRDTMNDGPLLKSLLIILKLELMTKDM
jgi:hypothetical protein